MTSDPGAGMSFVSDPKKPVGGHVLAHASTTRVMVVYFINYNRVRQYENRN